MPPREAALFVPGSLDSARTGGYEYDRRMVQGLRARGWRVEVHELDTSFPRPTESARGMAAARLASLADDSLAVIDGLALGAMPDVVRVEARRLRLVALIHHPLARETGLDPRVVQELEVSEREALASVRRVIVTSPPTAVGLADYGVQSDRIAVVEPGTDRAPLARGSGGSSTQLICVATITPRKGHATLVEALARLRDDRWTLTCAGSTSRDPMTMSRVDALVRQTGLGGRIEFVGELGPEALAGEYDRADVFVLPSWYEGYGMAVAEALARGLPIVSTPTGAVPSLTGAGGSNPAGILVKPGDVGGLSEALARVIREPDTRARLAAGARSVRDRLGSWDDMAARMEEALGGVQR